MEDRAVVEMRRELRVHVKTRERLRQIEHGIGILAADEELGRPMQRGDGVGVIRDRDDAREPHQGEGREHEPGRDRVAQWRPPAGVR